MERNSEGFYLELSDVLALLAAQPEPTQMTDATEAIRCLETMANSEDAIGYSYKETAPDTAREYCWRAKMLRYGVEALRAKASAPTPSAWQPGPPGRWICRTCGFQLTKAFLRAEDGAVGVDARPVYDICPNDGSSMRPITWEEDAADANRVGLEQMKRADRFEKALQSIANSACCTGCQEAALVAKAALHPPPPADADKEP